MHHIFASSREIIVNHAVLYD